ncbi:MAG: hypothetical protein PHC61_05100 [Chitinivibrionales bacterium]|nr:hypothetical protein [Chitinivibrionales bacterium]
MNWFSAIKKTRLFRKENDPLSGSILVLFTIIPIVMITRLSVPPLQDFPLHVAQAYILFHYHATPFFQQHFSVLLFPFPYLMEDFILLPCLFFGYEFAGKVLLGVSIALLAFGVWFLMRTFNPQRMYLCLFCIPLFFNKLFFKGNINAVLGIGFFLIALAVLKRIYDGQNNKKSVCLLGALAVALYFTHLVAFFVFAGATIPTLIFFFRKRVRLNVLYALAPSVVLWAALGLLKPIEFINKVDGDMSRLDALRLVFDPATWHGKIAEIPGRLVNFSPNEWNILLPLVFLWAFLLAAGFFQISKKRFEFTVLGALFLLYIFSPREIPPIIRLHERILFSLLFFSIACLGIPEKFRGNAIVSLREEKFFVLAFCIITALRFNLDIGRSFKSIEPILVAQRNLLKNLPPSKMLMPLTIENPYFGQIGVLKDMWVYYVTERQGLVPEGFDVQFGLVRFREEHPSIYFNKPVPDISQNTPLDSQTFYVDTFRGRKKVTFDMLRHYDCLLVFGDSPELSSNITRAGFKLHERANILSTYEKIAF